MTPMQRVVASVRRHRARYAVGALVTIGYSIVFQMVPLARDMHELGDVSALLAIPKIVYWIPVLVGIGASALMTVVFIGRWKRRGN